MALDRRPFVVSRSTDFGIDEIREAKSAEVAAEWTALRARRPSYCRLDRRRLWAKMNRVRERTAV
jgi:hypothetical protein